MSRLLLGVQLIVRNEADVISRCLESVRAIADELIVVDMGSADGTPDIARSFGAVVIPAEWEDDFAKARNIALAHSAAEWVLVIDADEAVTGGAGELRDFLGQTEAAALTVEMENLYGPHPWERVIFHPVRLFRRGEPNHFRFRGRLHEQIVSASGEGIPSSRIASSPLKLVHDGYLPEKIRVKHKALRNLNILRQMLADAPDDPYVLYHLGVTHCQLGQAEEAVRYFAAARKLAPPAPWRPTLIRDTAKVLGQLGQWDEAIELLQKESARYPDYADLHHLLGEALTHAGRWHEAREAYLRAAEWAAGTGAYVTEPGMGGFRTFYGLAAIARKLGALEEAAGWYEKCAALEPRFEPGLLGWADTLDLMGIAAEEIRRRLTAYVQPKDAAGALMLARVFTQMGYYPEALALLKMLEPQVPAAKEIRRECLMQTGQFAEALAMTEGDGSAEEPWESDAVAMDCALCFWSEELSLPYRFFRRLSPELRPAYEAADRYVTEGKRTEALERDPAVRKLTAELLGRAVRRKLIRIAEKLAQIYAGGTEELGLALYRYGYVLPAADRFLTLMKEGRLSAEGLHTLGEIVYDKGHYAQAAALFEQVLAGDGSRFRARIGAALCYLRLARELLLESLQKAPHHPAFHQDLKKAEAAIALLEATDWHTEWNAAERRNMHAAPEDLFVHDCER